MKKVLKFSFLMSLLFIGINNTYALERVCVTCGKATEIPELLPKFVSNLILIAQIAVPIILILTGIIRYLRAVLSGDEKVIKEVNSSFIKSIIAAIAVFLTIAIIKFAFTIFDKANNSNDSNSCVACFITGDCPQTNCTARDGAKIDPYTKRDKDGNLIHAKGCSEYIVTSESCPSVAEDGTTCKTIQVSGSSTPVCVKTCEYLSISECSKRDDCKPNGPSACVSK